MLVIGMRHPRKRAKFPEAVVHDWLLGVDCGTDRVFQMPNKRGAISENGSDMNTAIEFHDSDVQRIEVDNNGGVVLHFSSAYIYSSTGQPGVDAGAGHLQGATISFAEAKFDSGVGGCEGALSDGAITIDGRLETMLPIPYSFSGPVAAEFTFQNGATLRLNANGVTCSVHGTASFVETYNP
jgi:hypothetical protein